MFCSEFWKPIPPNEPFRVVLGNVRDRLYNTREYMRDLLAFGKSDIAEEDIFNSVDQVDTLLYVIADLSFHRPQYILLIHG